MKFETSPQTLRNLIDAMLRKSYPRPQFLRAIYGGRKQSSIVDEHADAIVLMVAEVICSTYCMYRGEDRTFSTYEADNVLGFACDLVRSHDEENADRNDDYSVNPYCQYGLPKNIEATLIAVTDLLITTFNEQVELINSCLLGDKQQERLLAQRILVTDPAGRQLINEMARTYPQLNGPTFGMVDKNGNFGMCGCELADRVLVRAAQHIATAHEVDGDLMQVRHYRHVLQCAYESLRSASPATKLEMEAGHCDRSMSPKHRKQLKECVKNLIRTLHCRAAIQNNVVAHASAVNSARRLPIRIKQSHHNQEITLGTYDDNMKTVFVLKAAKP